MLIRQKTDLKSVFRFIRKPYVRRSKRFFVPSSMAASCVAIISVADKKVCHTKSAIIRSFANGRQMDLTCKVAYDIMSFINVKNGINVLNTYIQRKTYH